jgi:hypothetical protein
MYAFLLALGAAITAAGLALVGSGVSLQNHAFDVSNVTPGIIAIIGGCILLGLAFVVRALLRVERALMTKPMPRAARPSEIAAEGPTERAGEPRIPFPAQPKTAETTASPATAEQAAVAASVDKSPSADRIESAPLVDAGDVSLLPNAPPRPDDDNRIAHAGLGKFNGSAHATTAPRVAGGPPQRPQPKSSIFDTLWPKPPRSRTEAQPAPAPVAEAPVAQAAEPAPSAPPPAAPTQTSAGLSILKSGVVEGMTYTLYSDGSIEAQLPGGTLRFRSITDLRSHIEQNG